MTSPAPPATSAAKTTSAAVSPVQTTNPPAATPTATPPVATTAAPVEAGLTARANATTSPAAVTSSLQLIWKTNGGTDKLKEPIGIAVDQQGNVYVSDAANNFVQKFDSTGKFLLQWGKPGKAEGEFTFSGSRPTAGFLAMDKQDNLYVADCYNSRIQKFDSTGKFLASWSSPAGGSSFSRTVGGSA